MRSRIDQVGAWIISVFLTIVLFSIGYGIFVFNINKMKKKEMADEDTKESKESHLLEDLTKHSAEPGEGEKDTHSSNKHTNEHGAHNEHVEGHEDSGSEAKESEGDHKKSDHEHEDSGAASKDNDHKHEHSDAGSKNNDHEQPEGHSKGHGESNEEGAQRINQDDDPLHEKIYWSYEGSRGPENWGGISNSYVLCKAGKAQSPIDIDKAEHSNSLKPLKFSYPATYIEIANNSRTLLAQFSPGLFIVGHEMRYDLQKIVFHQPSEHTVNGLPYDMEMQLLHLSSSGELAILAFFMEEDSRSNPELEKIWQDLPKTENQKGSSQQIDLVKLLPTNKKNYYYYKGSETVPPCSENVSWYVFLDTIKVSSNQVDRFLAIFRNNVRPTMARNGRSIQVSAFQS